MSKPKVAFFDFTCCEGCQIEFTNYGDAAFLELLNHVDVVEFREAMSEKTTDPIDIAFVEGSFTREADRARLESIRQRAAIVIAYGQCATSGGSTRSRTTRPTTTSSCTARTLRSRTSTRRRRSRSRRPSRSTTGLGCPVNKYEVLQIVAHLLHGKEPVIPNYPVCVECKRRETVCRYDEGDHCMGRWPVPAAAPPAPPTASPARPAAASSTTQPARSRSCWSSGRASRRSVRREGADVHRHRLEAPL